MAASHFSAAGLQAAIDEMKNTISNERDSQNKLKDKNPAAPGTMEWNSKELCISQMKHSLEKMQTDLLTKFGSTSIGSVENVLKNMTADGVAGVEAASVILDIIGDGIDSSGGGGGSSGGSAGGGSSGGGGGGVCCDRHGCTNEATYNFYSKTPIRCEVHKDDMSLPDGSFLGGQASVLRKAKMDAARTMGIVCSCDNLDCEHFSGEPCLGVPSGLSCMEGGFCIGWGHSGNQCDKLRFNTSGHYRCPGCVSEYLTEEKVRGGSPYKTAISPDVEAKSKAFIKSLKSIMPMLDDHNKDATEITVSEDSQVAVDHMMSSAGWDYASMRGMYG